jgi:hypothetical protein
MREKDLEVHCRSLKPASLVLFRELKQSELFEGLGLWDSTISATPALCTVTKSFRNATLQCLFNIPNFNEYFIGGQYLKELQPNGRVAEQYAKLASNVCGESSNKN